MLDWSIEQREHPVAIRVPGAVIHGEKPTKDYGNLNRYEVVQQGSDVAIIALGTFFGIGKQAAELIERNTGVKPTLIDPVYITGIDEELLESLKKEFLDRYAPNDVLRANGITPEQIAARAAELIK